MSKGEDLLSIRASPNNIKPLEPNQDLDYQHNYPPNHSIKYTGSGQKNSIISISHSLSTKVLDDLKVKPVEKAFAEKSLDRVKAHKFNRDKDSQVFQSRHELLQKEYKKVIECHPSTFVNPSDNYDDTEFLNRMFSKDKEALRLAKVVEE